MSKSLVGIVVLVSAIGGVAACGKTEKTKAETPASQLGVPASDVKYGEKATYETSVVGGLPPVPVETAVKPPRFTLELGEGKSGFKFRSAMLSEEAKTKIDEMFTGDKFDLKDARFEIEGYTDNLGSREVNIQMAIARARAVKQYLVEQHEFPEDCINVVGYGSENPVADNSTPEGRARNRRVVIKVVD
jgi:outer membrane protein OmpA-like peptidoglycan-associated protein